MDKEIRIVLIALIIAVITAIFAAPVSDDAIKNCMETTNYSEARCAHEIAR